MGRVCGTYEEQNACRVLVWKPEGNNLTDPGEEKKIILKWIFMKKSARTSTGFTSFGLVTSFRLL